MNKYFFILSVVCFSFSCKQTNQIERKIVEDVEPGIIDLTNIEPTIDCAEDLFVLESFIPLSNDIVLGNIKRLIIENEQIFILDESTPQIACFDLNGELLYTINNRGGGPKEFREIKDIAVNRVLNELIAYDSSKRRIVKYDLRNGNFLSEFSTTHVAPHRIAVKNGTYFFDTPDHYNYPKKKDMHYFLMYSATGQKIDAAFLPHDEISDYNFFIQPFFYNMEDLYYVKPFDNIVYSIEPGKITPTYKILLPNSLPFSRIKEKMNHWELSESDYSFGLESVYKADSFLHFIFSKDGFIVTTVYDLKNDKILYCGKRVLCEPLPEIPFYSLIDGVYKNKYFAAVPAWSITREYSELKTLPPGLENLSEEDNPVIAFYRVNN